MHLTPLHLMDINDLFRKRSHEDDSNPRKILKTTEERILEAVKNDEIALDEIKQDSVWLSSALANLQKVISENNQMHVKFDTSDPAKIVESEYQLNELVKSLSVLTVVLNENEEEEKQKLLKVLSESDAIVSLFDLVNSHSNPDIISQVLNVVSDWVEDDEEQNEELGQLLLTKVNFTQIVMDRAKLGCSQENLLTMLSILVSMASQFASFKATLVGNVQLTCWLFQFLSGLNKPSDITAVNQYSVEYFNTLLFDAPKSLVQQFSSEAEASDLNLIEQLLINFSMFRRERPEPNSEQEEFIENCVDLLCLSLEWSSTDEKSTKHLFMVNEGPELVVLLLKAHKWAHKNAFKVILACLKNGSDETTAKLAQQFVRLGVIKHIFKTLSRESETSPISVISAFLRVLPLESDERIRFVHKTCSNLQPLFDTRQNLIKRLEPLSDYYERLAIGLDVVQEIDFILSWLLLEPDSASFKEKIPSKECHATLRELRDNLADISFDDPTESSAAHDQIDLIDGLVIGE